MLNPALVHGDSVAAPSAAGLAAASASATPTIAPARAASIARRARHKLALGIVCTYATVLFIGTHWPRLRLPNLPVFFSTDKVCHFAGYLVLTFLLMVLPVGAFRRAEGGYRTPAWLAAAWVILLVAGCSFLDEATQPLVQRDMDRVDWACDVSGALVAICLVTCGVTIRTSFDRLRQFFRALHAK